MARYKVMTDRQKEERDQNILELRDILNDSFRAVSCMSLSRHSGVAYNTILKIKNCDMPPNSHYTIAKKLLKAVNSPYF